MHVGSRKWLPKPLHDQGLRRPPGRGRRDVARERRDLSGVLQSRAWVLEGSHDRLRGRTERADRELERLRSATCWPGNCTSVTGHGTRGSP